MTDSFVQIDKNQELIEEVRSEMIAEFQKKGLPETEIAERLTWVDIEACLNLRGNIDNLISNHLWPYVKGDLVYPSEVEEISQLRRAFLNSFDHILVRFLDPEGILPQILEIRRYLETMGWTFTYVSDLVKTIDAIVKR